MCNYKYLRFGVYCKSSIIGQNDILIGALLWYSDALDLANAYNAVIEGNPYYVKEINYED